MLKFKKILLLSLFSFSVALAETESTLIHNTRISADFGFGLPLGWRIPDKIKQSIKIEGKKIDLKISPNIHIGILASYTHPITENITIGPELGIGYGFTRKLQIKNLGIAIEEKYIQVPIYLRVIRPSKEQKPLGGSFVVGYDIHIILSSFYKKTGEHTYITQTTFEGDKNLKEFLKNSPKLGGSMVVGGGLEFPKGIYLLAKLKLPIEFFKLIKDKENTKELNNAFLTLIRALNSNIIEFSVGVDIMKFIY